MKGILKAYSIIIVLIFLLILFNSLSFSQEVQQPAQETQPQAQPQTPEPQTPEPQTQWVWGEVISVDTNSGQILVRYLDYETDNEKEIAIYTETNTTYENVTALSEIKPKDTVSIDYTISSDGKNIAQNISVEKIEPASTEPIIPSESEVPPQ